MGFVAKASHGVIYLTLADYSVVCNLWKSLPEGKRFSSGYGYHPTAILLYDSQRKISRPLGKVTTMKDIFPPELLSEYHLLIHRSLLHPLSSEEEARLSSLTAQLDAIEDAEPSTHLWKTQCARLEAELESIRLAVEALPDAPRK